MNALESNRYTAVLAGVRGGGADPERHPGDLRALVHQRHRGHRDGPPRTIHDFYGFPQELFDVEYPAPGLPEMAAEISDIVEPTWVGADLDSWGIDHGTWSVLVHAFPHADIPVIQLSINADKGLDYHLDLGAKLAPLRDRGVLIIGSGNVVHNLGGMNPTLPEAGYDWAERFDEEAKARMAADPAEVATLDGHRDYRLAVPTPDHFFPLLYLAGLAGAAGTGTDELIDGYAYGSLSMSSYTLGMEPIAAADGAGTMSLPRDVPVDDTNI